MGASVDMGSLGRSALPARCARAAPRGQARGFPEAAEEGARLGEGRAWVRRRPALSACPNLEPPLERPMAVTDRVKQILSWYSSDNPGTVTNLARVLNHGALAGTGKLVILPVDQG